MIPGSTRPPVMPPAEIAPEKFGRYWANLEERRRARHGCERCLELAELRRRLDVLELAVWDLTHEESA